MEVHLVDNLKANILVGTSVLNAHGISLDLGKQEAIIAKRSHIRIPIYSVAKRHSQLRRVIKSHHACTIAPNLVVDIPMVYHGTLPENRDFLYKPQSDHKLGHDSGVYAHIADSTMSFVKLGMAGIDGIGGAQRKHLPQMCKLVLGYVCNLARRT